MADIPEGFPGAPEPLPPFRGAGSDLVLALVLTGLLLGLFLFVATPVQLMNVGFGLWFTEVFVILGVTWVLLRASGRDPLRYPGAGWPGARLAGLGLLAGVVNFVGLAGPLQAISESLAPPGLRQSFDQSQLFSHQTPLELALIVGGVGIAAPICEEYFFRGVLQRGLSKWLSPAAAIAATGFLFSAFHLDPIGFAGRWELGALFGYLFYRTGSIWPGVMAHAANNLVSTGLYFLPTGEEARGQAAEQGPPAVALVGMFLLGTPLLFAVLRAVARSAPSPRVEEPRPAGSPPPLFRAARPWLLAALVSLALLLAVDHRGVILNIYDWRVELPEEKSDAPDWEKAERKELEQLRKAARAGKRPLDEYEARRRKLARSLGPPHSNR